MVGALIAIHFLEDGYDSASSRTYLAIKTPEPPWNIPMSPFFWRVSHELLFLSQLGSDFQWNLLSLLIVNLLYQLIWSQINC